MQTIKSDIRSWLWVLALVLVLQAMPEAATADEMTLNEVQAGSLLWKMQQGYTTATTLNTRVDMKISGLVARVSVRQEFRNEGAEWVEGVYVFPLPDKAAVDRMRLHVGDRVIEGEIREKEQAKKEYEQAKQSGKKTSLVQQQRANLFTTSVANVAPGELVVVEVEYLEDLRYEDGRFSIRFPMTLTPRYISGQALPDKQGNGWSPDTDRVPDASLITPPQVTASKNHKISLTAIVNAGMPLEIIASRYHPVSVSESGGHYVVALTDAQTIMDHDFELVWQPVPSAKPRAMAFTETIEGKPYHLLMVMPPDQDEVPPVSMPREMIFIVDTSGSMHGVSMSQAKRAVHLALKALDPGDLFNVIEFDSYTSALRPHSVLASDSNVAEALRFVEQLQADGGTEMQPALKMAFESPAQETHLRQIVFITDGSVGYEDEMFSMIEQKLGTARLFTVGIGSAPNSLFMRKAAEAGRGSYTFISALHEVREKMDALFRKLENPQVTDIEVDWPSNVIVDTYPSVVPDLYLGEPVSVKARSSNAFRSGDTVRISGNSVTGAWTTTLSLNDPEQSDGVAALWARARIGELMDAERRGANPDETRAEILETALTHHLVSKYTSLIAVDKTPARPAGDPLSSEQVPNLMPYGQSTNAIFGFPATATSGPAMRIMGAAWLLSALLMYALIRTSRPSGGGPVRGVRRGGYWLVAAFLCLGFWQFGHGAYIPAKAWLAQELMQRAWDRASAGEERATPWPWADTWPIARLTAEARGVDLIVLAGGSGRTLAFGPGHLSASAMPGDIGNAVIGGHRDTHFQFLRTVEVGDLLGIEPTNGERHVYQVVGVDIVDSRGGSLVLDTNVAMLSLVTCYPFDALEAGGPLRYVVTARMLF